jgi:hypothetical protein
MADNNLDGLDKSIDNSRQIGFILDWRENPKKKAARPKPRRRVSETLPRAF